MSTVACLSSAIHKHHAKYYTNITRIQLNASSGLYNCLETCDKDRNCTAVLVEKLASKQNGINCYIQNGLGNRTLRSGPDVQVLYKRQKIVRNAGRETREACLPCSPGISGSRAMGDSLGNNTEPSETQPVPHDDDSSGPPASNTNTTNTEEGAVSALGSPPGGSANETKTEEGAVSALGPPPVGSSNRTNTDEWATSVLGPPVVNTNRTNSVVGAASAPGPPAGSTLRTDTERSFASIPRLPETSISNHTVNSTNSTNVTINSTNTDSNSSDLAMPTMSNNVSARLPFDASAGCPPPFHTLPELKLGCFYIPDDFKTTRKTFEEAEKSCQDLHDLAHLIHTETKEVSPRLHDVIFPKPISADCTGRTDRQAYRQTYRTLQIWVVLAFETKIGLS